jgi:hypothetical protein
MEAMPRRGRLPRRVDKHFYWVPHTLLRETMWARITARTVEVFHHGQRVAAHSGETGETHGHRCAHRPVAAEAAPTEATEAASGPPRRERPGGNVTGLSQQQTDIVGKPVERYEAKFLAREIAYARPLNRYLRVLS